MGKAIGLIRVSTQAQEFESQSIKVKEAILKDGFLESDIRLIRDKESGSKLTEEERSGLNKLKRLIESEDVEAVYCYELSRLSRKAAVVYSIRDYLVKNKVNLICLNPYFRMLKTDGSFDESSNLAFGIFSTLAENETFVRTARIMRGKERKKSEGKLTCGKPIFGYTVDSEHYVIQHPIEGPVVREMFTRYAEGESSGSIGKDMYLRGIFASKTTKLVSVQTYVCGILRERRYGYVDGAYKCPIVSKETFDKVQQIRASKPERYLRKSRTICTYPLQGYIKTPDGYVLTPSISNNRYVKMNGSSKVPISLNMKGADSLSMSIMNMYLDSLNISVDIEEERFKLSNELNDNKLKLSGVDIKIQAIEKENDIINSRIIKGRLSEDKGDAMIDENTVQINKLEDTKAELIYRIAEIENRLVILANPLLNEKENEKATDNESLKELVHKYLKEVVAVKLAHSRYKLTYYFKDGRTMSGCFFGRKGGVEIYDLTFL